MGKVCLARVACVCAHTHKRRRAPRHTQTHAHTVLFSLLAWSREIRSPPEKGGGGWGGGGVAGGLRHWREPIQKSPASTYRPIHTGKTHTRHQGKPRITRRMRAASRSDRVNSRLQTHRRFKPCRQDQSIRTEAPLCRRNPNCSEATSSCLVPPFKNF